MSHRTNLHSEYDSSKVPFHYLFPIKRNIKIMFKRAWARATEYLLDDSSPHIHCRAQISPQHEQRKKREQKMRCRFFNWQYKASFIRWMRMMMLEIPRAKEHKKKTENRTLSVFPTKTPKSLSIGYIELYNFSFFARQQHSTNPSTRCLLLFTFINFLLSPTPSRFATQFGFYCELIDDFWNNKKHKRKQHREQ